MASICAHCRIGIAPTGAALCSVCLKKGLNKSKAPAKRKRHQNTTTNNQDTTVNKAVCLKCSVEIKLKPNGHFPPTTTPKQNKPVQEAATPPCPQSPQE
jgi:hypothetical protein